MINMPKTQQEHCIRKKGHVQSYMRGAVPICQTAPHWHSIIMKCDNATMVNITIDQSLVCARLFINSSVERVATTNLNFYAWGSCQVQNKEMQLRLNCNNLESNLSFAAFLTLQQCNKWFNLNCLRFQVHWWYGRSKSCSMRWGCWCWPRWK